MKQYVAAAALLVSGLLTTAAQAQTAPAAPFTGNDKPRREAAPKKRKQPSGEELARMQQRMSMNPDEVKRDQQQEVLDARAGISNSSLTRGSSSARQYDRASGGFTVREFRDKRNATMQKRGQARPAPGIDPPGKPLKHKKKKHFLGL
jgi:hypothetical protein